MKLLLERKYLKDDYTIGELCIDGHYLCDTLEDEVRPEGIKINGKTAIPYGTYKVIMSMSTRFGRMMPEILNVRGFTSIRIHGGNTEFDTEGCPLVGKNTEKGKLSQSLFYSNMLNTLLIDVPDIELSII